MNTVVQISVTKYYVRFYQSSIEERTNNLSMKLTDAVYKINRVNQELGNDRLLRQRRPFNKISLINKT